MADVSQHGRSISPRTIGSGYLFGVPLGDLGWFTTLLMSFAMGFAAFFAATFCAIVAVLFYNTATHRAIDFALTYKRAGLPVGVLVLMVSLGYLGTLWVRRQLRKQ
jgi:ABC-type dipeptide/oligopeptide/nickel transport system permease subunit